MEILNLCERPELSSKAALWFSSKWGVSKEAYEESIKEAAAKEMARNMTGQRKEYAVSGGRTIRYYAVPRWYIVLDEEENIIAGAGIVENDFNERKDLSPNLCALFVEEQWRNRGIAGRILDFALRNMGSFGIERLYLLTEHTDFYEKYGWKFMTMAKYDDGELLRLYAADCTPPQPAQGIE